MTRLVTFRTRLRVAGVPVLLVASGLAAALMAALPAAAEPPVEGLVSYWPLDEGAGSVAYDSVGSNDGVITNPNWSSDCLSGSCLDSVSRGATYAQVPDSPSLDADLGDQMSVEAWAFPYSRTYAEGQGNCGFVMLKTDLATSSYGFCVGGFWQAGMFEFHLDTIVGSTIQQKTIAVETAGRFDPNQWYHFVGTYDGSMMRFYVNGVEEGAVAQTGIIPDTDGSLWFGKNCGGGSGIDHCYHGRLDQGAIYNRVLTPTEIEQHYEDGGIGQGTGPVKLTASDGEPGDQFGWSIAIDGDRIVIGSKNADSIGAAYVFERIAGVWSEQAKLTPSDGAPGDRFGRSVAVDGDRIVVGAPGDDDFGSQSGSSYVFHHAAGMWAEEAKLVAHDSDVDDQFGHSVGLEGDVVVVGSPGDDGDNELWWNAGAAYVFRHGAGAWSMEAKLTGHAQTSVQSFGDTVAISGGTAMIGAPAPWPNAPILPRIHAFHHVASGWVKYDELMPSDPQPGGWGSWFGYSLDMTAETVVVGALRHDHGGMVDAGAAYVYEYAGGTWAETAKLTASDAAPSDMFGKVAVSGDLVVVGAQYDDDHGIDSGSAYVLRRGAATWEEDAKLTASDGAPGDQYGLAVAIDGGTVVAGAPFADDLGSNSGAAYLYTFDDTGPVTAEVTVIPNPVAVDASSFVTATVNDSTTGNSVVASAEYSLDSWATAHALAAQDGTFDSPTETVETSMTSPSIPGVYDLCVRGSDVDANTGPAACTFLVAFDPEAGFVTGGGWIDSPEGAYTTDPLLVGKANFGFVSRYKKGATVPTGTSEFQFKAGDLNFHSDSYEWLVVTGGDYARFKGVGTINGAGSYKFQIWASDGDSDAFRIKIWTEDEETGVETVIYDNGFDQTLGGGSIIVHT